MKGALLSIAATLVLASSASAQTGFGSGRMDGRGSHATPGAFTGRPPHNNQHRSPRSSLVFFDDYGDYDANRSFDPDRWNDWWHERPERSYPRWVWRNQDCTPDRMWWSGAGWRCTP